MKLNSITIYVGLIGAGKTYSANRVATPRPKLLDFDSEWHDGFEQEPLMFANRVADMVNVFPIRDWVFDGWWTWNLEWWKNTDDLTLQHLDNMTPNHKIVLRYLKMDYAKALCQYIKKQETGLYSYAPTTLGDPFWYSKSILSRISYLEKCIEQFENRETLV